MQELYVQRATGDNSAANLSPTQLMSDDIVYPSVCKNERNFPTHQTEINDEMHTTLVDWLVEVCNDRRIQSATLSLSVHVMDEFLKRVRDVPSHRFQLLGCACLLLSAKLEQVNVSVAIYFHTTP
jgi:hypothetical protein